MKRQPGELEQVARGAAWILLAGVIVRGLDAGFESRPLFALAFGAFAVDLVSHRVGTRLDDDAPGAESAVRKVVRGATLGLVIATAVVLACRVVGVARIRPGSPSWAIALAALRPLLQSARDELLFHGMPLALAKGRFPDRLAIPFAALLGAAPLAGVPGIHPEALALAIASGAFFALLWRSGDGTGGWIAFGAHAGWLFATDLAIRGALLDVSLASGALAPAARASGWPALLATAAFALLALSGARRLREPR